MTAEAADEQRRGEQRKHNTPSEFVRWMFDDVGMADGDGLPGGHDAPAADDEVDDDGREEMTVEVGMSVL